MPESTPLLPIQSTDHSLTRSLAGHGRWRAIPVDQRDPTEDPWAAEANTGMEDKAIDADGSVIERIYLSSTDFQVISQKSPVIPTVLRLCV